MRAFVRIYGSKNDLLNDRINSHFLPFTRLLILDAAVHNVLGPASGFLCLASPQAISTTTDINRCAASTYFETTHMTPGIVNVIASILEMNDNRWSISDGRFQSDKIRINGKRSGNLNIVLLQSRTIVRIN